MGRTDGKMDGLEFSGTFGKVSCTVEASKAAEGDSDTLEGVFDALEGDSDVFSDTPYL